MAMLSNESNQVLKEQLKLHEGVKHKLYLCTAGKQTIGVGRNLDDLGITEDEAMYLLGNDIKRVESELGSNITLLHRLSEALKEQLKRRDGVKYKLHLCTAGKQTIGVGRNLEDLGISEDEAMYLLDNDIQRVGLELEPKLKKNNLIKSLSESRKVVLMNMAFNLGINRLFKFKKMFLALESQQYVMAADEMLDSRWAKQVGNRAIQLSEIMKTG